MTRDMESLLYDYYAWDPYWGMTHFGGAALPNAEARLAGDAEQGAELPPPTAPIICIAQPLSRATPFTRSTATSAMSRTCSSTISNWEIRYLVIATRNWWPGKVVRLSPYAVKAVDWFGQRIDMNVSRERVMSAPAFDPLALMDEESEAALHRHFGWPGYRR